MENKQLKDETLNMKDLIGYEDHYKITENGEIFSKRKNRFLRLNYKKNGYVYFETNINGINKTHRVHRLVAITFIPNIYDKPYVNHKDGNKSNNHISNLEWVTGSENNLHFVNTLESTPVISTKPLLKNIAEANNFSAIKVNQFDRSGNFIKQWNSMADVQRAGITRVSDVSRNCRNYSEHAGGYVWEYVK